MPGSLHKALLAATLLCSIAGAQADNPAYPHLPFDADSKARTLWLDSCEGCHGYGIAGAPIPMQPDDWRERLEKPRSVLYSHAIEGFFGPDDTMMPARGGNPDLTDEEVKLAVDYMLALATYYLEQTGDSK